MGSEQDKSANVREVIPSASEQVASDDHEYFDTLKEENKKLKERVKELQSLLADSNGQIMKCNEILTKAGLKRIGNADDEGHQANNQDQLSAELHLKDAVAVFPEEIWTLIFAKLDDRMDLWSCSKACLLLHRMLHKFKTTFLFPEVLPHLFRYFYGSEILGFRSICKTWKDCVDHFFENHASLRPYQSDDIGHHPRMVPFANPMRELGLGRGYVFDSGVREHWIEPSSKFHTKIVDHPRNPIIGRCFHIEINSIDDNEFLADLYRFLETFGHHIWYLTVSYQKSRLDHPQDLVLGRMIQLLTNDLFRLVPNMRKFCINDRGGHYPINPTLTTIPLVASLESLEIEGSCVSGSYCRADRIHPLHRALSIQCHAQLRRLHVDIETWKRILHMDWPNLVELHINGLEKETLTCLTRLRAPKVQKLGVSASANEWEWNGIDSQWVPDDQRDIDTLLRVIAGEISHYSWNTLRIRGEITVQSAQSPDYPNHPEVAELAPRLPYLMPPQLKTLELEYFPDTTTCYDFLLRFPFLENLNMFWAEPSRSWVHEGELVLADFSKYYDWEEGEDDDDDDDANERSVEIDKYVPGHLHRSNIWKLLPKLKLFTFNHELYTRGGHEEYVRWRNARRKNK